MALLVGCLRTRYQPHAGPPHGIGGPAHSAKSRCPVLPCGLWLWALNGGGKRVLRRLITRMVLALMFAGTAQAFDGGMPNPQAMNDMQNMLDMMDMMRSLYQRRYSSGSGYDNPSPGAMPYPGSTGMGVPMPPNMPYPPAAPGVSVGTLNPFDGVWQGVGGEILEINGNRFRLNAGPDRQGSGTLTLAGDRLIWQIMPAGTAVEYEWVMSGGRFVLRDASGQTLFFVRRDPGGGPGPMGQQPGGWSGGAAPPW